MAEQATGPDHLPTIKPENLPSLPPELAIYNSIAERISDRYPHFVPRPFNDCAQDLLTTYQPANLEPLPPELLRGLVTQLASEESFDNLGAEIAAYWQEYNLVDVMKSKTVVVAPFPHIITDLPILFAAASLALAKQIPDVQRRLHMSVGPMIPVMAVDIWQTGEATPVSPLLQSFSGVIRSVPPTTGRFSGDAKKLTGRWNNEAKKAIADLSGHGGQVVGVAVEGANAKLTNNGQGLKINRVNSKSAQMLTHDNIVVVPVLFRCDALKGDVIAPAPIDYKFMPPRTFQDTDEVHSYIANLAELASLLLKDEFPGGVHYESELAHRVGSIAKIIHP